MANKTNEPLNPVTHAKQLARCIESGMSPRKLAEFGFAQGAEVRQFVLASALMPAPDLAQRFRDDPEAWHHLEPVSDRLMLFLEGFRERAGELAAELRAKEEANCEECQRAKKRSYSEMTTPGFFYTTCEKHRPPEPPAPELIANPGDATSSPAAGDESPQPAKNPAFGQFDPIAGRRVP